jgi:aconitase B
LPQLAVFAGAVHLQHPSACASAHPVQAAWNEELIIDYMRSNITLMKWMTAEG